MANKINVWRKEKQGANSVTADYNRESALAGIFLLLGRRILLDA